MKKLLLPSFLLTAVALNAQITVSQWDVAGVNKIIITAHDTTHENHPGTINPGSAGANQTWTFTALTADSTDTTTFTNPNWLSAGSKFPGSNLAAINPDSSINFLLNNASGLYIKGIYADVGTGSPTDIHFMPDYQHLKYADTYTTSFTTNSTIDFSMAINQPPVDSVRVKQIIDETVVTDGWGTLKTPLGNYNSLRHRSKQVTTDTIWVHYLGSWFPYQTTKDSVWHFEWWPNNVGYALLAMDSTTADSVRNINWLKVIPVAGAVNELSSIPTLHIFPNPAVSQINFEVNNAVVSSLEIFDLAGNRIATLPSNRKNILTYNAEVLSSGTYFYRTVDSRGNTLNRGKFDVIK